MKEISADVAVIGGGLGGVSAALAALRAGRTVVVTEEFAWLGGQLTSQGVPPDEHSWVEQFGVTASYRSLREGIRAYYRRHYPLTDRAGSDPALNPGAGWVSRLRHEPTVAVAALESMLAPYRSGGPLTVLQPYVPVAASADGDRVTSVTVAHPGGADRVILTADFVIDATETGELLPLTGTEYVTGFESQAQTGEPSAPAAPQPQNMQAVSVCFAIDSVDPKIHGEQAAQDRSTPIAGSSSCSRSAASTSTVCTSRCWSRWARWPSHPLLAMASRASVSGGRTRCSFSC